MPERYLVASPLVRRFAETVVEAASGKPILDVACGSGRNALFLAQLGCSVVCVDKDLSSLDASLQQARRTLRMPSGRLLPKRIDLLTGEWPFGECAVGGIINVHFLLPQLIPRFAESLILGGYLLLETVSGHGGNYLKLPREGELRDVVASAFELILYQERLVGPCEHKAVSVKLLARRRG